MAQKYWFKARGKKGVGWVPSSWQGWLILALYVGLLIHSYIQIDETTHSVSDTLINFLPRFLLFTGLLTVVTYLSGEPTTWHHEKTLKDTDQSTDKH